MDKKILILDIDGTLVNSKKEITPRTFDAIMKIQEMGHIVALASGRPYPGMKQFVEKLKIVEKLTDSFRDKDYVTQVMPMTDNQEVVKNREGKTVPHMNYNSGKLEMGGSVVSNASIHSVFRKTEHGCALFNIDALQEGKPYRTSFYSDEPIVGGVKETMEVTFKDALTANYIDIDTVNSDIKNVPA